ncbi:helix-turn-helix domain-containing protein [Enterobacter kobei]|uniref:helix-turn-helix domain-containing protein n=1 Tax=Enterobacter kobei TaxID=208224 RepID=UPI0021C11711|nr:helix-turn-helix domain-containing protein [Enterobacter kobei]UXJ66657.1 helix-turn-helix domain-containing protein [Enterobacter kobei]HDC4501939.1 helix-turn-helix domain-containing protein [Enterobacter kobei]
MKKDELHVMHLLEWIEDNLHLKLDADAISEKSGYTKWHLQKMFKSFTGSTMGEYVRSRRLCKAAFELKFSNKSIIEIVKKLRFETQASFTRSFTNKYGVSPARFRSMKELPFGELVYRFSPELEIFELTGKYVYYDHLQLYGVINEYICPVDDIKKPHREYRKRLRKVFLEKPEIKGGEIFTLGHFSTHDYDNSLCQYHLGIDKLVGNLSPLPVVSGDFIQFDYEGEEDGIYEFVMSIYFVKFRAHNVIRRDYFDIEIFRCLKNGMVNYSYLIPIVFEENAVCSLVTK